MFCLALLFSSRRRGWPLSVFARTARHSSPPPPPPPADYFLFIIFNSRRATLFVKTSNSSKMFLKKLSPKKASFPKNQRILSETAIIGSNRVLLSQKVAIEPQKSWPILYNLPRSASGGALASSYLAPSVRRNPNAFWRESGNGLTSHAPRAWWLLTNSYARIVW